MKNTIKLNNRAKLTIESLTNKAIFSFFKLMIKFSSLADANTEVIAVIAENKANSPKSSGE